MQGRNEGAFGESERPGICLPENPMQNALLCKLIAYEVGAACLVQKYGPPNGTCDSLIIAVAGKA